MNQSTNQLAVLSLDVAIAAGADSSYSRVQLLPAGEFAGQDGRPSTMRGVTAKAWLVDAAVAAELQAQSEARTNDYVIDYEHQTLLADENGKPAPAAGWFKKLEFSAAKGVFAVDVRWTAKAKDMIAAGEYKYISPVFLFDIATGRVTKLLNAALTNNPNLDGMDEVRLAALKLNANLNTQVNQPTQEPPMKQLMAALKLNQEATEADALVALKTLQDEHSQLKAEVVALSANQFDPAKHIPLSEHSKVNAELVALKAETEKAEHATLMADAVAKHLIPAVNEAYWQAQPLAALKEFLKVAKPVVTPPAGTQTGGKAPAGEHALALNAEEQAVCKALGQTPEAYAKAKQAEAV